MKRNTVVVLIISKMELQPEVVRKKGPGPGTKSTESRDTTSSLGRVVESRSHDISVVPVSG